MGVPGATCPSSLLCGLLCEDRTPRRDADICPHGHVSKRAVKIPTQSRDGPASLHIPLQHEICSLTQDALGRPLLPRMMAGLLPWPLGRERNRPGLDPRVLSGPVSGSFSSHSTSEQLLATWFGPRPCRSSAYVWKLVLLKEVRSGSHRKGSSLHLANQVCW